MRARWPQQVQKTAGSTALPPAALYLVMGGRTRKTGATPPQEAPSSVATAQNAATSTTGGSAVTWYSTAILSGALGFCRAAAGGGGANTGALASEGHGKEPPPQPAPSGRAADQGFCKLNPYNCDKRTAGSTSTGCAWPLGGLFWCSSCRAGTPRLLRENIDGDGTHALVPQVFVSCGGQHERSMGLEQRMRAFACLATSSHAHCISFIEAAAKLGQSAA